MNPDTERRTMGHVATITGLTPRQIDYWLRHGAISIEDGAAGTGYHRQFTLGELYDLEIVARLLRTARVHGLDLSMRTIGEVWHALQSGEPWRCVLDIDEMAQ